MANEKRLIDANALIHRVCAERDSIEINHACDIGYHNGLNMAVSMAINAPTVDTVEVKHGQWFVIEDDYFDLVELKCSACGESWGFEDYEDCIPQNYHYCPNCGAKMDMEVDV